MSTMTTTNGQAPRLGQQTRASDRMRVAGITSTIPGLGPCPAGTYDVYRRMRSNPTVALVRAAGMAPVKAAAWSVEAKDEAPDGAVEFIQQVVVQRLRPTILKDGLRSLDYGWQPFEKVWDLDTDGRLTIRRLKPLLPDDTKILHAEDTGAFLGVRHSGQDLAPNKCWCVTYDGEGDDRYGRSRMENVREWAWHPWIDSAKKLAQYMTKGAGVIPVIRCPTGLAEDESGAEQSTFDMAMQALTNLSAAKGIIAPWVFPGWAHDMLARGIDPSQLVAWQFEFLEAKAGHGDEFLSAMKYHDGNIASGWLTPPRMTQQGTGGTLADATAHGELGVQIAQETSEDLVRAVNQDVVDDLLRLNWGERAVGTVYVTPAPLVDADRTFLRDVMRQILTNPANIDLALTWSDMDAALDQINWPKAQEVVDSEPVPLDRIAEDVNAPAAPTTPGAEVVQDQALNGAQIASMVELAKELATRQLPPEAVRQMMVIAFPTIEPQKVDRLVNALAKFTPAPVADTSLQRLTPGAALSAIHRAVVADRRKSNARA